MTYLDLLDLIVQTSNVSVGFLWGLLHFHHCHQGIGVIHQHPNHSMNLNMVHTTGIYNQVQPRAQEGENVLICET